MATMAMSWFSTPLEAGNKASVAASALLLLVRCGAVAFALALIRDRQLCCGTEDENLSGLTSGGGSTPG